MSVDISELPGPKYRASSVIGERVHALMWKSRRTQKQLAAVLQIGQPAVSDRLHGKTEWSAMDIAVTAAWLGVPVQELIPDVEILPDGGGDDDGPAPTGAPTRARTWDLRIKRLRLAA